MLSELSTVLPADWLSGEVLQYAALGFVAQLVDGALGMGYGVITTTVLLHLGIPPVAASASVHTAEVATTATSGMSHWLHRNVDWRLLAVLALSGVAGGVTGAYILTGIAADTVRPFVASYLFLIGIVIFRRAFAKREPAPIPSRRVAPLGVVGGMLDAMGGGGWGAVVSSTLIAGGSSPRFVIGSVTLAEFFVSASVAATFAASIGIEHGRIIVGLLVGGVVAAPLAGYMVRRAPTRALMILVGLVVMVLSLYNLVRALS